MKNFVEICLAFYFIILGGLGLIFNFSLISIGMVVAGIGILTFSIWGKVIAIIICSIQLALSFLGYSLALNMYKHDQEVATSQITYFSGNNGVTGYHKSWGNNMIANRDARDVALADKILFERKIIESLVVLILLGFVSFGESFKTHVKMKAKGVYGIFS